MSIFFAAVAVIGLVIFAVGAILFLVSRPAQPTHALIMVIGGLVFAIGEVVLLSDVIF
jgi:hypothetical protein